MCPGLLLALGAGLQVSSQGTAATLVPAGTTTDLRPTVVAQSLVNNLDNVNRQLSVTCNLNLWKLQVFVGTHGKEEDSVHCHQPRPPGKDD